ncbi:hypothetical protein F4818DRAFT_421065 [Hypoxylon cercidicola]|nr:hypothetical protein F4818DRAFT_421065 [Hypoxylon cercidicola]
MCCFHLFLRPDYPLFPTSPPIREYFNSYVRHFDLLDHVCFNATVSRMNRKTNESENI